jgi:hypothetical protein
MPDISDLQRTLRPYVKKIPGATAVVRAIRRQLHAGVPHERIFTDIHDRRVWSVGDSVHGWSSTLEGSREVREHLPAMWRKYSVRSLVDAPCGDLNWMRLIVHELESYVGIDIVRALVEENRTRYGSPRIQFREGNILYDALPPSDMILCRDCLTHFSNRDISRALENIKRASSKYVLTTTYRSQARNHDIPTGSWRPLNLERAPFAFPPPIDMIDEGCPGVEDKTLALWRIGDLP